MVCGSAGLLPGFRLADEVDKADAVLEMPVSRLVLVACAGSAVVGEAQTVPRPMLVVLVEQALIRSVEARTACREGLKREILSEVGGQEHDA